MYIRKVTSLSKENPQTYEPYLALGYNDLALLYSKTQRFNEAEQMYKAASERIQIEFVSSPGRQRPIRAIRQGLCNPHEIKTALEKMC